MTKLSEAYGPPLSDDFRTAWEIFTEVVQKYPDDLALACIHQSPGLFGIANAPLDDDQFSQKPYLRWTYSGLSEAVSRFSAGLRAAGVQPGAAIFTFQQNNAQHAITLWSAVELDCPLVPLNPRNLINKDEVSYMVNLALGDLPKKKPVVIAADEEVAKSIDSLGVLRDALKIVVQSAGASDDWVPFETLLVPLPVPTVERIDDPDKVVNGVVLFTSGTTSLPKGTLKQYPMVDSILDAAARYPPPDGMVHGSKICGLLPNNHAMGHFVMQMAHAAGAALVLPGPGFQPDLMLDTLHREKITQPSTISFVEIVTALVPTMVHALLGLQSSSDCKLDNLVSVMFGGGVLTPGALQICINELGAKGVENAYGMTEGYMLRTHSQRDISTMIDGEDVCVGWVQPGNGLRIADPDTNEVLPINTPGEIHGSSMIVTPYLGGVGKESFYHDNGRMWFKTGDQARMDEQGRVFVVGRYKEMIIRGGENMSPIAIEEAIKKDPALVHLNPQIVGVNDPIAGDVPVAIVLGPVDAALRGAVQNAVLHNMGNIYIPEAVISLQDLGLSDYPRTMAGKIKRIQLSSLAKKYLDGQDSKDGTLSDSALAKEVQAIWARSVGLEPSQISLDTPISEFADSITTMRVREMVKRNTGRTVSLVDMVNAGTIAGHIRLLQEQTTESKVEHSRPIREGPPGVDDMAHLTEDPDLFEPTKNLVLKTISPFGLDWNDVEDILPAYDFANVMTETRLFDSWSFKMSFLAKADKTKLRAAFEIMFANMRILTSFLVRDEDELGSPDSLHVTIRQNKKWFDKVIQDGGQVKSVHELIPKTLDYKDPAAVPGPLTQAILYDVEETGTTAAVLYVHHAVVDASMGQMFADDLDRALNSTAPLPQHVDYKPWTDSYYNLRTSSEARAATKWHTKRLKGLKSHKKALWPPFTMPTGPSDSLVQHNGEDAVQHSFIAHEMQNFRRQNPQVTPTIVLKTALALVNMHRTGHSHALFANLEAARTVFPFINKALGAAGQFEATDVAGPTIQAVINLIEFKPEETVLSLLERMQEDQVSLTKYAAAPLREIMNSLGTDGSLVPEVIGHQSFNWVPGMSANGTNPQKNFEALSAVVKPRQGFSLNAGMGGSESNTIFLHLRGIGLDTAGYKQVALDLEKLVLWIIKEENWKNPSTDYVKVI
ncbi:hypothetical protein BX600DRAFT_505894 [Xylariales sp. PMI_506]|nr:hypothetical protein BX600DRAFT_505894 [Xylariales sp. PMI_506]